MKEYLTLQKKYSLPTIESLDKYFQVSSIEEKKFLLKEMTKKIHEKIYLFTELLEDILNPETLSSSHESSMFNEEEKKEILKVFRKLQYYNKQYLLLEISSDENEQAQFIKEILSEWETITFELKKIIIKIRNSWNKDKKIKLELGYFG
ncbi:MAG: hypothetical protein KJ583_05885 [Nanoarchaeota archaeon]|nr:hypothetical protein [Nanoarchaeota archaeon]MBU1270385.1 hypothetical protein [Nanoarchaeota archaeon]MBU1604816.1 hypothetical protein [Nanoarchaeota archaeon]MBU2442799.1 hypothetical protein [Nanoarchaeota archaeon]